MGLADCQAGNAQCGIVEVSTPWYIVVQLLCDVQNLSKGL